jgi:hypothetical protein
MSNHQIDLFDSVFYCDNAPVANLNQFYDYVQRTFTYVQPGSLAVSPPIPLRSGGGWYVGRASFEYNGQFKKWMFEPYDRISDYYQTESEAADVASWHRWNRWGVTVDEA